MIPAAVTDGLAALQDAVTNELPLETAAPLQIATLADQGRALIAVIDTSLTAAAAPLDGADPAGYPFQMAAGLAALSTSADDASALSGMRGLVGRAVLNLAQGG